MEKSIVMIIPQLLAKLPEGRAFYSQNDLSDYGYPPFLIKRIAYHVHRKLLEQFNLPDQEWINTKSEELLTVWSELDRILKREIHLPSYLAEEIVGLSARECIGMTIRPRMVIPDLLFENEDELDANQLTERSSAITVNRILVWSIIRYMEKKGKERLNIDQTVKIIETIDDKIVENYNPLNWLSLVKPLFELSGNTVNSDLLREFFEHKGKNHIAREFDLIDGEVKENRFIEILSSPKLIRVEGYHDEQQSLFQEPAETSDSVPEFKKTEPEVDKEADDTDEIPIYQSFSDDPDQEPAEWTEKPEGDEATDVAEVEIESEIEEEEVIAPWEDDPDSVTVSVSDAEILEIEDEEESEPEDDSEPEVEPEAELEYETDEEPKSIHTDEDEDSVAKRFELESEPESDSVSIGDAAEEEPMEAGIEEDEDSVAKRFESESEPEPDSVSIGDESEEEPMEAGIEEDEDSVAKRFELESELEPDSVTIGDASEEEPMETSIEEDEDSEEREEPTLLNRFMFDDSNQEEITGPIESDPDDSLATIYDELNLVRVDGDPETLDLFGSEKTVRSDKKFSDPESDEADVDSGSGESGSIQKFADFDDQDRGDDSNDSEIPMWRSFLEREDDEETSSFQFDAEASEISDLAELHDEEEPEELLDEDGYIEEPIYDLTKKEPELEEKIGDLSNWMLDVREKFIEELFGDSEDAYEQALSDIMEYDDWKNASRYIEKEIFTRNRVDIYDEIAVDFTDRLHTFFIENKS